MATDNDEQTVIDILGRGIVSICKKSCAICLRKLHMYLLPISLLSV